MDKQVNMEELEIQSYSQSMANLAALLDGETYSELYSRIAIDAVIKNMKRLIDENQRLKEQIEDSRWRDVEQEFPEEYEKVLIAHRTGVGIAYYQRGKFADDVRWWKEGRLLFTVSHWKPLPKKPDKKKGDK